MRRRARLGRIPDGTLDSRLTAASTALFGTPGRNGRSADGAQQTSLECLHVWWVHANGVGYAARQNVTEKSETSAEHGIAGKLPGDCRPWLQNRERRRGEKILESRLNRRVQRLVEVVRDRIERTTEPRHFGVRIYRDSN